MPPSPNVHSYRQIPKSSLDAPASKVAVHWPFVANVSSIVVGPDTFATGAAPGLNVTVVVSSPVWPEESVTVSFTVQGPRFAQVWLTDAVVPAALPSPKSQL